MDELSIMCFYDAEGREPFSHWSVVIVNEDGSVRDVATGVMHNTPLQAWRELRQLEQS
jgi:hypothetical protein